MSADGPSTPARTIGFLLRLGGMRRVALLSVLMILSSATEGLGLLLLVSITQIVSGNRLPGFDSSWLGVFTRLPLAVLLAGFVGLVTFRALIVFAVLVTRRSLSLTLTQRLRRICQQAIVAADWRWLSTERSADHAAMIVGEAGRIGSLTDQALNIATGGITLCVLLATALYIAWPLTLATLAVGLCSSFALSVMHVRRRRDGDEYSEAYAMLQRHVSNGLAHLRAARIAGAQSTLTRDFSRTARQLQEVEQRYFRSSDAAHVMLQVIAAVMLALLVYLALTVLVMPLALLVPTIAIFGRIVPILGNIQQGVRSWRFCTPALDGMLGLIERAQANAEPLLTGREPMTLKETIDLDCVTVRYAERIKPVFEDFSLTIAAGSVLGITGPSGSGKSTLADLLSGLIAPDAGVVRIDGVPLDGERRIRWRQSVAYVEQSPYLFDGTIAQNISWGRETRDVGELHAALRAASAQFVLDLPEGLETAVGESGRQLSGGERQRIALARALLRKPSLLVLDEVTSALDAANEDMIARTIERLRGSCTFLILSHRKALLELADTIVDLAGNEADDRHGT